MKRYALVLFLFRVILFFIFQIFAVTIYANGRQYTQKIVHVTGFDKSDYGGANKSWSVTSDENGYMYFGNDIGLVEFDGVSWNLYPSYNNIIIRCVNSFDNRIYSGGYRELGYWERNNKGGLDYVSLTSQVEDYFSLNEEFWNITILDGHVYFRSFTTIYIYTPDEGFTVIPAGGFISSSSVVDGDYLVALSEKGVFRIEEGRLTPFIELDYLKDKSITQIIKPDETYPLLVATESHGVYRYFPDVRSEEKWANENIEFFTRNRIDKAMLGQEGEIILGTIMNGVLILDKKGRIMHHVNVNNGLQSNTVHSLAQDDKGNLWVTSDRGIDCISFSSPMSYSTHDLDEVGAVYAAALYKDYLYIGTNQGLFKRPWDNPSQPFELVPGTQRQVWDCTVLDDMLFVGHNSGTFIIDQTHQVRKISSFAGGSSIAAVPGNPDLLIQSTYNNLIVYKKENQRWGFSNTISGFSDLIQSVEFDHRGNLWASHPYRGIYKIKFNSRFDSIVNFTLYDKDSHLWNQGKRISVFKVDNRMVITNGKHIYTYDDLNDSIIEYDQLNGPLQGYSQSFLIANGKGNHYWFMNRDGVALFRIYDDRIEQVKEFPSGLYGNNIIPRRESLTPISNQKAILCLENGYAILDAAAQDDSNLIAEEKLMLRKVQAGGNSGETIPLSPYDEKISTSFTRNNLSLVYSFPFFPGQEVKFQYLIEGLTDEWSSLYETPEFTINRIPAGNYFVKVRAVNKWQKSSEVNQIALTVSPPFYRSPLAFLIYFFMLVSIFLLVRYLIRRKLELRERQRTEEKEQEMIKQRNKKLRSDLSFKSRQLATSALSMAKKNESLLEIKKKLSSQKEKLGTRYPDRYFNEIIRKIDEGITGDDEWKVFEHNFNLAHETFLHQLKDEYPDLTPNDLRLCAFLRINLASKEIASLLGISVRGVENHRYRLRKKLNLSAEDDLAEFLFTFQGEDDESAMPTINDEK